MNSLEARQRRIADQAQFAGDLLRTLVLSPTQVPHDQLVFLAVSLTDQFYATYTARLDALKEETNAPGNNDSNFNPPH